MTGSVSTPDILQILIYLHGVAKVDAQNMATPGNPGPRMAAYPLTHNIQHRPGAVYGMQIPWLLHYAPRKVGYQ
jgi:hypothetical protein